MSFPFHETYKKDFLNSIEDGNEIEIKYYNFDKESLQECIKFLNDKDNNFEKKNSETIDYLYKDSKRITVYDDRMENTTKTTKFTYGSKFKGDEFKITVSQEEKKTIIEFDNTYTLERVKKRTSYIKDNFTIDITEVNGNLEIETEVLDSSKFDYDDFVKMVYTIYILLLPMSEKIKLVISFFNSEFTNGKNKSFNIINTYFSKARDLELRDLTYDSIIKNLYSISVKASGDPKYLIYHKTGIWLYHPSINEHKSIEYITYPTSKFTEVILAGELLISSDMKPDKKFLHKYKYLPYDALYYNENLMMENYIDRKLAADSFSNTKILQNGGIYLDIEEKKNIVYDDISSFYKSMKNIMEEIDKVDYKTDGIILTPINDRYITEGQVAGNRKDRILSKYQDVCKWKPVEEQTIDYKVSIVSVDEYSLQWSSSYPYTKYHKTKVSNFSKNNYNTDFLKEGKKVRLNLGKNIIKELDKKDLIIEFKVIKVKENNYELVPKRIRYDKDYPNSLYVIDKNWSLIIQPISTKTLLGEDTTLMKRYHNTIKTALLEDLDGYVLDIGSGKGGDINKYKKAQKVLLVEPNEEFIEELKRRLSVMNSKSKYVTLNAKGEDSELILKKLKSVLPDDLEGKTLYITFMISLTFFWKDIDTLKSLSKTITKVNDYVMSINGKVNIVYLTIKGTYMKELFNGQSMIELNTIILKKQSENSLTVEIKDSSTVKNIQTEYLVNIDDLMKLTGFNILFSKKPDYSNVLMSYPEMRYSSVLELGFAGYNNIPINAEPLPSLKVDETKAKRIGKKSQAIGDDKIEQIEYLGNNIFRMATLTNNGICLIHSVLKLTSEPYRESDVFGRVKMAKIMMNDLNNNLDLNNLSKHLKLNIAVYYGNILEDYNNKFDKYIYINKCKNKHFESIIKIVDDKRIYYFDKVVHKDKSLNFDKFKDITLPPSEGENNLHMLYAISNVLFKIVYQLESNDMTAVLHELEDVHYSKSSTKTTMYTSPDLKYSYNNKSNLGEKIDNSIYDKLVMIDKVALNEDYKDAFKMCLDLIDELKLKYYSLSEGYISEIIDKCLHLVNIYKNKIITNPQLEA